MPNCWTVGPKKSIVDDYIHLYPHINNIGYMDVCVHMDVYVIPYIDSIALYPIYTIPYITL